LFADGFDEALIGSVTRCTMPSVAMYDSRICIEILMKNGMTYEEAVEYFDFNLVNAWVGENTPCFADLGVGF
jgi:hypothetical protein